MNKRVVVINDEIGTIALGFSKAGYEISAICVEQTNKNSIQVLRGNWGDVADSYNLFFAKRNFLRDGKNQVEKPLWTVRSRFRG